MPAPVIKGILVTVSLVAALGAAALQNPQIQAWLEEQRQLIANYLQSFSHQLDPQSRRTAEAFAFEGRTPANDDNIHREARGSQDAVATATGRRGMADVNSTVRRIPVRGPADPDEAEERRKKGREYLAQRNREMFLLQRKRGQDKTENEDEKSSLSLNGPMTPTSPTSFDAMVDDEGKLRRPEKDAELEKELPSPPLIEPLSESAQPDMSEKQQEKRQALLVEDSASAWSMGSQLANPFSDEHAMERSETPKPPIPPKIALDKSSTLSEPPSQPSQPQQQPRPDPRPQNNNDSLTYEEQLAIALSLSEADSPSAHQNQQRDDDDCLRAAIAASLKEIDQTPHPSQHTTGTETPRLAHPQPSPPQPLIDFTTDSAPAPQPAKAAASSSSEEEEDLYTATPSLTHARLATHNSDNSTAQPPPAPAQQTPVSSPDASLDDSFASFPATQPSASQSPRAAASGAAAAASVSDFEGIEIVDLSEDDSDFGVRSGARTPGTEAWSEVGSEVGSGSEGEARRM